MGHFQSSRGSMWGGRPRLRTASRPAMVRPGGRVLIGEPAPRKTTLYTCFGTGQASLRERLNWTHAGAAAKTVQIDGFEPGIINLQAKTVIFDRFGPLWKGDLRPLPTRLSASRTTRPLSEFSWVAVGRTFPSPAGPGPDMARPGSRAQVSVGALRRTAFYTCSETGL